MTKHLVYAILLLGLMITATGCSDEAFETPSTEQSAKGEQITITVGLPENDDDNQNHSRVAFDDESLKLTWQEGDEIRILALDANNNIKDYTSFDLISGVGTTKAQFSGEWFFNDADHYQIFYNAKNLTPNHPDIYGKNLNDIEIDYQDQAQIGASSKDHLKDYLLLSPDKESLTKENIYNGEFVLTPKNSIFRFNIKSYPDNVGNLKQIIWNSNMGSEKQGCNCMSIDPGTDATGKQAIVAYMAFKPAEMKLDAGQCIALTLIGDKGVAMVRGVSVDGLDYQPGKRYTATVSNPVVSTKSTGTAESAGATNSELNDWVNIPNPKNNEVLVITADGSNDFYSFEGRERIEGTNCTLLSNNDLDINYLDNPGFAENEKLLAVHFPETLTELPEECFLNCKALVSVKLPSNKDMTNGGFTKIKYSAFYNCKSLVSINLPEGVTSIGDEAFRKSSFKEINLPSTLKKLGSSAFQKCKITSIHIPDNVEIIPMSCFEDCKKLKEVTGCKGVSKICSDAFKDCTELTHYEFTNMLEEVQNYAFKGCEQFTTPLPLTVTIVGVGIIADSGIREFTIHDDLSIAEGTSKSPLALATQLRKLTITSAYEYTLEFIPEINDWNPNPAMIDLYILKDWASKTGNLKPDVTNKTWNGLTWKSITLIDKPKP